MNWNKIKRILLDLLTLGLAELVKWLKNRNDDDVVVDTKKMTNIDDSDL